MSGFRLRRTQGSMQAIHIRKIRVIGSFFFKLRIARIFGVRCWMFAVLRLLLTFFVWRKGSIDHREVLNVERC